MNNSFFYLVVFAPLVLSICAWTASSLWEKVPSTVFTDQKCSHVILYGVFWKEKNAHRVLFFLILFLFFNDA